MTEIMVEAAEMQWNELAKEMAHLDVEWTDDRLEQEAALCQEAMINVRIATVKTIRICAKSIR
jgi:hypothetical protein